MLPWIPRNRPARVITDYVKIVVNAEKIAGVLVAVKKKIVRIKVL